MQTFDQSLMSHVKSGLITYDEALKHVSNPDDFALRFRGIASTSDSQWNDFDGEKEGEAVAEADGRDGGVLDDLLSDGTPDGAASSDDDFNIERF